MLLKSSIARKVAMSLSALFLMVFLLQHFIINLMSVLSPEMFNSTSHFMGTNPVVQFIFQPILMFGVVFHFVMGFILEMQNRAARPVKYAVDNGAANSTWMSRNMIYSGLFILVFLTIHMIDFWIPEMNYKYIQFNPEDPTRYHEELVHKFMPIWRVALYVIGFVFLSLHLLHGFQSAFQSVGARSRKYTPMLEKIGKWYAILVPAGFIFIALFHHFTAH